VFRVGFRLLQTPRSNNNNESSLDSSQSLNHDKYIGKNFWGYVKEYSKQERHCITIFQHDAMPFPLH
jgi:hypothetical protein